MLSSEVKFSADRQTDIWTSVKQDAPVLSMRGHEKVKLLKMSYLTFFHNVFFAIYILKSLYSHIKLSSAASLNFRGS